MKHFIIPFFLFLLTFFVTTSVFAETSSEQNPIKHVVLIGWDGFGSAYVNWDEIPTLKKMKENGAWTVKNRSVLPSVSAINWASILMGAGSELHGYRQWGSAQPDIPSASLTEKGKFPDIFSLVHQQMPGAITASVYTWDNISNLHETPPENYTKYIPHQQKVIMPEEYQKVVDQAIKYLNDKPVLSFFYFDDPDTTGHTSGWGSPEYQKKLTELDGYLAQILKYLEDNNRMNDTIIIFVSDHGGTGKKHGSDTLRDMETPFIIYGAGVKQGEINSTMVNYDTAATIAWALNLKLPECWRGKPVTSAFKFQK
ncbi:MAG: alkaline phosphatase [Planctomycetia bacterium]|nr:alkaline phosphatase [Planctomycetia bacterium]